MLSLTMEPSSNTAWIWGIESIRDTQMKKFVIFALMSVTVAALQAQTVTQKEITTSNNPTLL